MSVLGLVIPVYNEEALVETLYQRISTVLDQLAIDARVCLIDDGSRDRTPELLHAIAQRDPRFGYISFSRNFGHQTAVLAGVRELDADVYVVMDGDLQDPPELIPDLLDVWRRGHEVVYCVREKRKENIFKRAAYATFYRLLRSVSYLDIPLDTGDFCLMDRVVVDHLRSMPEHNQFVRGLRTWVGFRQTAFHYERDARAAGEPKYNLRKLFALAYDGLISFSFAPLRLVAKLGLLVSGIAFLVICALVFQKIFFGIPLVGWTSMIVTMLFMGGVQLLTLGVVGEYVARIFDEVKARPLYVLKARHLPQITAQPQPTPEPSVMTPLSTEPAAVEHDNSRFVAEVAS